MLLGLGLGAGGAAELDSQIGQADPSESNYLESLEIMPSPHLGLAPPAHFWLIYLLAHRSFQGWEQRTSENPARLPSQTRTLSFQEVRQLPASGNFQLLVSTAGPGIRLFRPPRESQVWAQKPGKPGFKT